MAKTSQVIEASEGTYTVTVTNSNDCTGTDEVTVIENTNAEPSISGELQYCASDNTTLWMLALGPATNGQMAKPRKSLKQVKARTPLPSPTPVTAQAQMK
ncbi:MAG: hypothetical protein R3E32_11455 [Chitinophagales bacterium]